MHIVLFSSVLAFVLGVVGLKGRAKRLATIRSWFTLITSTVISLVLFGFVLFPVTQHLKTTQSPDGRYKVAFVVTNGGAATSPAVIGRMDGPLWFSKIIYDSSPASQVNVKWENDDVISINGTQLNLKEGQVYDDSLLSSLLN